MIGDPATTLTTWASKTTRAEGHDGRRLQGPWGRTSVRSRQPAESTRVPRLATPEIIWKLSNLSLGCLRVAVGSGQRLGCCLVCVMMRPRVAALLAWDAASRASAPSCQEATCAGPRAGCDLDRTWRPDGSGCSPAIEDCQWQFTASSRVDRRACPVACFRVLASTKPRREGPCGPGQPFRSNSPTGTLGGHYHDGARRHEAGNLNQAPADSRFQVARTATRASWASSGLTTRSRPSFRVTFVHSWRRSQLLLLFAPLAARGQEVDIQITPLNHGPPTENAVHGAISSVGCGAIASSTPRNFSTCAGVTKTSWYCGSRL